MTNLFLSSLPDQLHELKAESFFADCLRAVCTEAEVIEAIKMIVEQARDNRAAVERQIGADLLKKIESHALYS